EFVMTDLGPLNYFLGISVTRDSLGLFLSQNKYAVEILDRAHMVNYNPSRTPIDTKSKLGSNGDPISDPTLYRSLAGDSAVCSRYFGLWVAAIFFLYYRFGCIFICGLGWFPTTHRSTLGCVFLGNNLLSWSFKRQPMISRSSAEAEYHDVANAVAETCLRNLLRELHTPLSFAMLVYCENVSAIYL
ncbi:ribonuclease H-like domain-containing protein, partial [Tanacetum coccineum]